MTSPNGSVPAGAYTGPSSSGSGTIGSLQSVTFASAQASILATVTGSFQGMANGGANLNSVTRQALSAANSAASGAVIAQSTAQAAQNTTAANSVALAGLTAAQTGQQTGGTSFSDTFGRTSLGPGYTTFTTGQVAALVVSNGQVGLNQSGDEATGDVVALSTTVTLTNDQAVSVVMGAANQAGNASARVVARAAADLSTFVYARIYSGRVYLGYGTRSGGVTSYNDWTSAAVSVNTGDTVTLQALGATYEVLVNGAAVTGYSDTAVASPVGAANRSFGFGSSYYWSGLFGYFSFNTAGLAAADLSSPPVVGTGWGLYRINSTGVSQPTGEAMVAAGTFDSVRQTPNGVTVVNQGLGQIQVQKSGWYAVSAALNFGSSDYANPIRADIWTAPSPTGSWSLARTGASTAIAVSSNSAGVSSVLYLSAGMVVAPGCLLNVANNTIVGPNTFFDGALLSP